MKKSRIFRCKNLEKANDLLTCKFVHLSASLQGIKLLLRPHTTKATFETHFESK